MAACSPGPDDRRGDGTDAAAVPRQGLFPQRAPQAVDRVVTPLPGAYCTIFVEGVGELDLEEDYLPHVIQCENGGADLEALRAQAVAARSVAYYAMARDGSICDSQGCQVYSCGREPGPEHYQAVVDTSGIYLNYNNTLTYGFFVAGDSTVEPPQCRGILGAAPTERWVTYNEGRSGTDVAQTELGFVFDPEDFGYGQNRGCMGQWGARCLENANGYDWREILAFFYGDDIGLTRASGECVVAGEDSGGSSETAGADGEGSSGVESAGETTFGAADGTGDAGGTDDVGGTSRGSASASSDGFGDGTGDGTGDGHIARGLPEGYGLGDGDEGCGCGQGDATGLGPWSLVGGLLTLLWPRRRSVLALGGGA